MTKKLIDMFIIGGGINGAGIARDAAGRGLSVILVEQNDLASATSSASSKLIHGGLRYLEYYQFSLVRKALIERELLLKSAPHIIWPTRFVIPHNQFQRPKWLIRLGLFLYDSLYLGKKLKSSRAVNLQTEAYGTDLKPGYKSGFVYSDCRVHDSRLVVLNAQDAAMHGAEIFTQTKFTSAKRVHNVWEISYQTADGKTHIVQAKTLVNAAGPWIEGINQDKLKLDVKGGTRLIAGSHIIVPKLFDGDQCYLFQNSDNRVVFAIPYEHKFTMVGTTDIPFEGDASQAKISPAETAYLCDVANQYFEKQIKPTDVKWSFTGVRALFDDDEKDAKAVTRDYRLDIQRDQKNPESAPLLTVYGGKITTFRHLGQQVCQRLRIFLPHMGLDWTRHAILPGGDIGGDGDIGTNGDMAAFVNKLAQKYSFLPAAYILRLATHYGSKTFDILADATQIEHLGTHLGADIYAAEVDYVVDHEWVTCTDDFIWRRTRLGLHIDAKIVKTLDAYIAAYKNAKAS
ncbi:MAG: glycerol-3-phosphate dehydrogenase [Hyphomicrobiales bacterium]|nr:glycerol-3-phosphate dehydrogenase [Hyphomicrobiales bacterium]